MSDTAAPQPGTDDGDWSYSYTPRLMPRVGIIVAVIIVVVHVVFGALLTISNTGPDVGLSDQLGLVFIGVVEAGAVIMATTRARLRLGAGGIGVRNVLSEKVFRWDDVSELIYPEGNFCARLVLPSDDYVAVVAIQARDRERAVAAMERFREFDAASASERGRQL